MPAGPLALGASAVVDMLSKPGYSVSNIRKVKHDSLCNAVIMHRIDHRI